QHVEGVCPGNVETLLAAPAQLVKADGRERADQREAGGERKQERQERITQDRPRQHQTDDGINQAQEYRLGRYGGKIGEAACQRVFEVREADAAHRRTRADRIRPHENVSLRHGRTSRASGSPCRSWSRRAATRTYINTAGEDLFATTPADRNGTPAGGEAIAVRPRDVRYGGGTLAGSHPPDYQKEAPDGDHPCPAISSAQPKPCP